MCTMAHVRHHDGRTVGIRYSKGSRVPYLESWEDNILGSPVAGAWPDSLLRQVVNAIFAKVSVKPDYTITTDSFEFMTILVSNGFGIGFQVRLAVGRDPMRPEIVYVPIRDPAVRSAVLACCISEQGTPSMAVSVCLQDLRRDLERWCRRAQRAR